MSWCEMIKKISWFGLDLLIARLWTLNHLLSCFRILSYVLANNNLDGLAFFFGAYVFGVVNSSFGLLLVDVINRTLVRFLLIVSLVFTSLTILTVLVLLVVGCSCLLHWTLVLCFFYIYYFVSSIFLICMEFPVSCIKENDEQSRVIWGFIEKIFKTNFNTTILNLFECSLSDLFSLTHIIYKFCLYIFKSSKFSFHYFST